jgi:hypothetical protein
MEPLNPAAVTPADMLACYDKSLRGEPLTITEKAVVNRLAKAAAFASQAYLYLHTGHTTAPRSGLPARRARIRGRGAGTESCRQ